MKSLQEYNIKRGLAVLFSYTSVERNSDSDEISSDLTDWSYLSRLAVAAIIVLSKYSSIKIESSVSECFYSYRALLSYRMKISELKTGLFVVLQYFELLK